MATDCQASKSDDSVCICGSTRCDSVIPGPTQEPQPATPEPSPTAIPTATPVPTDEPDNQEYTKTWNDFVEAKNNNGPLPVPDFSYVGYQNGASAIPSPNWPVINVTDYGASPNDSNDDLEGIKRAIAEAEKRDGAIVLFPKGRYLVSEKKNITSSLINLNGGNIILRGEGSGEDGSVLFFREHLNTTTPEKKWTTPAMINLRGTNSGSSGNQVTNVTSSAKIGDFSFDVADTSKLSAGDHIVINLSDANAAKTALAPYIVESAWSKFKEGEFIREHHQIAAINGKRITLKSPIYSNIDAGFNWEVRKKTLAENLGLEKLRFEGNWKETFKHHKDYIHDGGWTAIRMGNYFNSWMYDVHFANWNATVSIVSGHSITVNKYVDSGNRGHSSLNVQNASSVLITDSHNIGRQGQFHSFGVSNLSSGIVYYRVSWPQDTTFDCHASFPRSTLFDRVDGGFSGASGGGGGAEGSQPNHMDDLIFWNFKDLGKNDGVSWDWWRYGSSKYGRWLLPKIIGWHGAVADFDEAELAIKESHGEKVNPESLYEAQLKLRLGELPEWLQP